MQKWNIARVGIACIACLGMLVMETGVPSLQKNLCDFLEASPIAACPDFVKSDHVADVIFWVLGALLVVVILSWPLEWLLRKVVAPAKSPLAIIFDEKNQENVRIREALHDPASEFYSFELLNTGTTTLSDIKVRALDSWFTRTVISDSHGLTRHQDDRSPVVVSQTHLLHPNAPERVQLFELPYHSAHSNPDYILNTVQRFTLEASARDTPAVQQVFEYDPAQRPMLKALRGAN